MFGIVYVILFGAALSSAAEPASADLLRNELVSQAKQFSMGDELKSWYLQVLSDDAFPIDEKQMRAALTDKSSDKELAKRQLVYQMAMLFRWRQDPAKLVAFCDQLPYAPRASLAMLLDIRFKSFVAPAHAPIFLRLISDTITMADDAAVPRAERDSSLERARHFIRMGAGCDRKAITERATKEIQNHVVSDQVRVNLMFELVSVGGPDAIPLADWYWDTYCVRAFETKVLMDYFKANLDEAAYQNRIQRKRPVLIETMNVLAGRKTLTTEMLWPATQPATRPTTRDNQP